MYNIYYLCLNLWAHLECFPEEMVAMGEKVVKLQILVVFQDRPLRASAQDALCIKILINYFLSSTLPILPTVKRGLPKRNGYYGTCWDENMVSQCLPTVQLIKVKNVWQPNSVGGSVKFWCKSGSMDPYLWLMDPDPDPNPDPTPFFSDFNDEKILFQSTKHDYEKREGSHSGSVALTNVSGSGRPKNIKILRIRIRFQIQILNTATKSRYVSIKKVWGNWKSLGTKAGTEWVWGQKEGCESRICNILFSGLDPDPH